jgi:lipopolysaccharide/colanic/teichoic acid biosynthesis glycosyltransferase
MTFCPEDTKKKKKKKGVSMNALNQRQIGQKYTCWYNRENESEVVLDISLDRIFWIGIALIIAVFFVCILVPVASWFIVTSTSYCSYR